MLEQQHRNQMQWVEIQLGAPLVQTEQSNLWHLVEQDDTQQTLAQEGRELLWQQQAHVRQIEHWMEQQLRDIPQDDIECQACMGVDPMGYPQLGGNCCSNHVLQDGLRGPEDAEFIGDLISRNEALESKNEKLMKMAQVQQQRKKKHNAATCAHEERRCLANESRIDLIGKTIYTLSIADFSVLVCTCKAACSDMLAMCRCRVPDISVDASVAGPASPAWYVLRTRMAGRGGASLLEKAVLRDLTVKRFSWTRFQLASGRYVAACVPLHYVTPGAWKPLLALQRTRSRRCRRRLQTHLDRILRGRPD
jgi:hypothetical protein